MASKAVPVHEQSTTEIDLPITQNSAAYREVSTSDRSVSEECWIVQKAMDPGSQAAVFLVARATTGCEKQGILKVFTGRDAKEAYQREIKALRKGLEGAPTLLESNDDHHWVITEFFRPGPLGANLDLYIGRPLVTILALASLVKTVAELHDNGFYHGDIKASNIFVEHQFSLILGDFGTAESVDDQDRPGKPTWPKCHRDGKFFDVSRLGMIFMYMLTGIVAFKESCFDAGVATISKFRDASDIRAEIKSLVELFRPGLPRNPNLTAREFHGLLMGAYLRIATMENSEKGAARFARDIAAARSMIRSSRCK